MRKNTKYWMRKTVFAYEMALLNVKMMKEGRQILLMCAGSQYRLSFIFSNIWFGLTCKFQSRLQSCKFTTLDQGNIVDIKKNTNNGLTKWQINAGNQIGSVKLKGPSTRGHQGANKGPSTNNSNCLDLCSVYYYCKKCMILCLIDLLVYARFYCFKFISSRFCYS